MGVGKSTIGRALAEQTGLPFVDLDEALTRRHGPIVAQFANDGEAAFRERESALLLELCDGTPRVLATGGGTWVADANRTALRAHYALVVLTAPLQVLQERVTGEGRPNWAGATELFASRAAAYADADLTVDATAPVADIVHEVLAWWS